MMTMRRLPPTELYKAVMDGRTITNSDMTLLKENDHWCIQGRGFTSAEIRKIVPVQEHSGLLLEKVIQFPKLDGGYTDIDIPLGIFDLHGAYLEEANE